MGLLFGERSCADEALRAVIAVKGMPHMYSEGPRAEQLPSAPGTYALFHTFMAASLLPADKR
jgi:hypothetical protein